MNSPNSWRGTDRYGLRGNNALPLAYGEVLQTGHRPTWPLTVVSLVAVAGLCLFLLIMWRRG